MPPSSCGRVPVPAAATAPSPRVLGVVKGGDPLLPRGLASWVVRCGVAVDGGETPVTDTASAGSYASGGAASEESSGGTESLIVLVAKHQL